MMDISLKTETFGADDPTWMATAEGTDRARTITLDLALWTAGTYYPNGYIKSGYAVKKVASGLYAPFVNGDTNFPVAGHLMTPVNVPAGVTKVSGALYWHGAVIAAKLPQALNATGQATITSIRYF
ncbi:hypothetical protein [Nocardia sp. N2S4-5]|uniref:hypothetical protein n=1 Tax=Nocardia sp. N2S4-5 TaxID=3351565 RepID=UPI0037CEF2FE